MVAVALRKNFNNDSKLVLACKKLLSLLEPRKKKSLEFSPRSNLFFLQVQNKGEATEIKAESEEGKISERGQST